MQSKLQKSILYIINKYSTLLIIQIFQNLTKYQIEDSFQQLQLSKE